jgi:Arc/MetJ family transcription regulator
MCIGVIVKQSHRAQVERTNIVLDTGLVSRVKRLARVKTTREAVHLALEHYIRSRDYSAVLALRGSGGVTEGYDPKTASPAR